MILRFGLLGLVSMLTLAACTPEHDDVDAGQGDADTVQEDADAPENDAASGHDAAMPVDAEDAGFGADATSEVDAALLDSGFTYDAALDAGTDAEPVMDAATEAGTSTLDGAIDAGATVDASAPLDASTDTGPVSDSGTDAGGTGGDASSSDAAAPPCGVLGDLSATSGRIWDLGHGSSIVALARAGNRLVSFDYGKYWALWDLDARNTIARGQVPPMRSTNSPEGYAPPPLLAGGRMAVVSSPSRVDVRRISDGALMAAIPFTLPYDIGYQISAMNPAIGLSPDGSYVWVATTTQLVAKDLSGTVLVSKAGDYSQAAIVGAQSELRIVRGPAGANTIEKISVATGNATSATFLGTFRSWSQDGQRFATVAANTVRVYAADTVQQQAIAALPTPPSNLIDSKDGWLWTSAGTTGAGSNALQIYSLADTSAPIAVYSAVGQPFLDGSTLTVLTGYGDVAVSTIRLDLPGAPSTQQPVIDYSDVLSVDPQGNWAVGNTSGTVFEEGDLAHPISCGKALSISGADNGRVAIATASGGISLFELSDSARRYSGNIPFDSDNVRISRTGGVLGATATGLYAQYEADRTLRTYSLPSLSEIRAWPSMDSARALNAISDDGTKVAVARVDTGTATYWNEVLEITTGTPSLRVSGAMAFGGLSPSGSRIALVSPVGSPASSQASNFYEGTGTLMGVADGVAAGWLDEARVLVATYVSGRFGSQVFVTMNICGTDGAPQAAPGSPPIGPLRLLPGELVYSGATDDIFRPATENSRVYSPTTGNVRWSGPPAVSGSVAGSYVVHTTGAAPHEVVIVPY